MTTVLGPHRLTSLIALTAAWCAMWGSISIANLAGGLVLSAIFSSTRIGTPGRGGIRIRPLFRLITLVFVDLVQSTIAVAREVLSPEDTTNESIIAVQVPLEARDHLLLLVVAITLTPGTAVIDLDADANVIYLHLLHDDRRADTIHHVNELAQLACAALPRRNTKPTKVNQ